MKESGLFSRANLCKVAQSLKITSIYFHLKERKARGAPCLYRPPKPLKHYRPTDSEYLASPQLGSIKPENTPNFSNRKLFLSSIIKQLKNRNSQTSSTACKAEKYQGQQKGVKDHNEIFERESAVPYILELHADHQGKQGHRKTSFESLVILTVIMRRAIKLRRQKKRRAKTLAKKSSAVRKVFRLPELLSHILSFVPLTDINPASEATYESASQNGLKHLAKCRLVKRSWKYQVDNSPDIIRNSWRARKDPKNPGMHMEKVICPNKSQPVRQFKLCYPFLSWLANRIHSLQVQKQSFKVKDIEYSRLTEMFVRDNFPHVFFSSPPVTHVSIGMEHSNRIEYEYLSHPVFTDAPEVREIYWWSSRPTWSSKHWINCVVVKNINGVTAKEIIDGICWFMAVVREIDRARNQTGKPSELKKLKIGISIENEPGTIAGSIKQWAELSLSDLNTYKMFDYHDYIPKEKPKQVD